MPPPSGGVRILIGARDTEQGDVLFHVFLNSRVVIFFVERVLLPLLDVLQSVPILSFLPVVLISLSAVMPHRIAAEIASVVLIFTSQAWNMTFGWYQSLKTIPQELREATSIFRLNTWMQFKTLELPFAAIPLIWNSMMSWAGGWFFLMAAEIFTVGQQSFRLPGLGAYLQTAASQGNMGAIGWGLATLIIVIVVMDQWIWRPLLAWADRFKIEMLESDTPPTSWFFDLWHNSRLVTWFEYRAVMPIMEQFDANIIHSRPMEDEEPGQVNTSKGGINWLVVVIVAALIYGLYRIWTGGATLLVLPLGDWVSVLVGVLGTMLRSLHSLGDRFVMDCSIGVCHRFESACSRLAPAGCPGGGIPSRDCLVSRIRCGAGHLERRLKSQLQCC